MFFRLASALALSLLPALVSGDGSIYIIRHGEKRWTLGCLNDEGQARAQNLIQVFSGDNSTASDIFEAPKAIFAVRYADLIDCERAHQTVNPLAEHLGVTVNHKFGYNRWVGGNRRAAAAFKEAMLSTGGPVLVAWEHINIQHITRHLGVARENVPTWLHGDYDTIYHLRFDDAGNFKTLHASAQNYPEPHDHGHRRLSEGEVLV